MSDPNPEGRSPDVHTSILILEQGEVITTLNNKQKLKIYKNHDTNFRKDVSVIKISSLCIPASHLPC